MRRLVCLLLLLLVSLAGAAPAEDPAPTLQQWLLRLRQAAGQHNYVGTFVVTGGQYMSSSRIWHVQEGSQQVERVQSFSGSPRSTFRRNDEVVTFLPEHRLALRETRQSLGLFTNVLQQADASIGRFYRLQSVGLGRVAGLLADIVELVPLDSLRFGYRIWTERESGLIIKLQTLDRSSAVLETAAFSDLQLAQPLSLAQLSQQMDDMTGYQVQKLELIKVHADQEGWSVVTPVAGFRSVSVHRRVDAVKPGAGDRALQWVFSDGLASVSLFIEPFDSVKHGGVSHHGSAFGATQMTSRRLGDWWVTAVGEVPQQTLAAFVQRLERKSR